MTWQADVLVIFGATGDLARKMTLPALYRLARRGALSCPVVGVAATGHTARAFAALARQAIERSGEQVDDAVFARFARQLTYVPGDVADPELYKSLDAAGLLGDARVAVEKPFGHDLASAVELDDRLRQVLAARQLLLVDHFLGKEPVIEVEYLRFANFAMAELWHRNSVEAVQITMAESIGVSGRGGLYDAVGALRDVVQNHLSGAGHRSAAVVETLRITPDPGLRLQLSALDERGAWRPARLDTAFARELGTPREPYERLLADALTGDDRLFARQDAVRESWRIVQPLMAYPSPVHGYEAGSWGPPEADALLAGHPPWQSPWLPTPSN